MKQADQICMPTVTNDWKMIGNSQSTLFHPFDGHFFGFESTGEYDAEVRPSPDHPLPIQSNFARFTAHFHRTLKSEMWLSTDRAPPPFLSPPIRWVPLDVPFILRPTVAVATIVVRSLASLALFQTWFYYVFWPCFVVLLTKYKLFGTGHRLGLTALNQFLNLLPQFLLQWTNLFCDSIVALHQNLMQDFPDFFFKANER